MTPFEISEQFVDELLAVSPLTMTSLGLPGAEDRWDDLSPNGAAAKNDIRRRHRQALDRHLDHPDSTQREAARVLAGYLDIDLEEYATGDHLRDLNHIYCSFTVVRDIFDIMDRDSQPGWDNITSRLDGIGEALGGWCQLLAEGVAAENVVSRRQVESIIEQAESLAGDDSMFVGLAGEAESKGFAIDALSAAVEAARTEVSATAQWLRSNYLPYATEEDGVGPERYVRSAERFLGLVIDPKDTYQWGWDEIARIRAEMLDLASEIDPSLTIEEVCGLLETDPSRALPREEFTDFVQDRLNQAVEDLDGLHFAVPGPIRRVTVNLAPPGGALGAWYINPSVDWQRPGSVWYSLGDRQNIPLWQEVSTAYHEGFPGHHLQVGTSMYQADSLSKAHRLLVWYSGYGEGWALYTERLMDELGYFEKPDYRMGMLASQLFRAVRVVVDLGCHLEFEIPSAAPLHPGEEWSFDRAVDYINHIGLQPRDVSESEVKRYLGWPGQAISYKVGEREILDIRRSLQTRDRDFDPKTFHRRVLEGGELRLDHLRRRMLE